MSESLPSPPRSRPPTPDGRCKGDEALAARLDELLEQYLELLDEYTRLRSELSQAFSSGFFSLAQAQRASALGAGRRYGEECYDERMKAQRIVLVSQESENKSLKFEVHRTRATNNDPVEESVLAETSPLPVQRKTNERSSSASQSVPQAPSTTEIPGRPKPKKPQDPATRDPITWFGILVPPALRQTQSYFAKAVEHSIPELLSAERKMRVLEEQIWSTREELGISHAYETHEENFEADVDEDQPAVIPTEPPTESRPSHKSLASRPAHSKPPLLKLGD